MWDGDPVGSHEGPVVSEVLLDPEPTFVHKCVMLRAQQHEVIETRLTTIGPVFHMMAV